LPILIDKVAEVDPERIALRHNGTTITYAALATEIMGLDEAMGGGLGADALVSVVVSSQLPALLESMMP
jgi:hypothetical protein